MSLYLCLTNRLLNEWIRDTSTINVNHVIMNPKDLEI